VELAAWNSNRRTKPANVVSNWLSRQNDLSSAPTLIAEADALVEEGTPCTRLPNARRRAVLQGLATLGYEVNEGNGDLAWVPGAVRWYCGRPLTPDYGVELAGRYEIPSPPGSGDRVR